MSIQNEEAILPANFQDLVQLNEIQELLQQQDLILHQQSKSSNKSTEQRPSSPQQSRPESPAQGATLQSVNQPRPTSPIQPLSPKPQTPPPQQKQITPAQSTSLNAKNATTQQQKLQMQQVQLKQIRQQLDTLQTSVINHVQNQQIVSLTQNRIADFERRTQNGLCAFANLVLPPNMESGDYVLTCVDCTTLPDPSSKAGPFISYCTPDSILIRVVPQKEEKEKVPEKEKEKEKEKINEKDKEKEKEKIEKEKVAE